MTTSTDPTNTPHECVSDCVPDCVSEDARATSETSASPVPSSSIGDALSEPSPLRPNECVSHPQTTPGSDELEPHGSGAVAGDLLEAGAAGPVSGCGCNSEARKRAAEGRLRQVVDELDLGAIRERAVFWAGRDPEVTQRGLYDRHAVAFAGEVVTLLAEVDRLSTALGAAEGRLERVRVRVYSDQAERFRNEAALGVAHPPYASNRYLRLLDDVRAALDEDPR